MSDRCFYDDELGALADRPPEDAALAHLAACAKCRARLASYRRFLSGSPDQADPDREAALGDFVAAMVASEGATEPVRPERTARRTLIWTDHRLWAGGLATAAVLLLMLSFNQFRDAMPDGPDGVVRGGAQDTSAVSLTLSSTRTEAGGLRLQWDPWPTADSYRVVLLDAALAEVFRQEVQDQQHLVLVPATLATAPDARLWSLTVLADGDVVHTTAPAGLPLD